MTTENQTPPAHCQREYARLREQLAKVSWISEGQRIRPAGAHEGRGSVPGLRGLSPPANFRHPAGVRRSEGTTDINRGLAKVPEGRRTIAGRRKPPVRSPNTPIPLPWRGPRRAADSPRRGS
jgi:hypothetical protein